MGINAVNSNNYNYYTRGVNNNFTLANSYANAPIFTGVNKTNIDSFQNSQTVVSKDGKDDGSIGFFGAVGNLFKGVGNFFKGMVCDESGKFSWTRTLTTIGIGTAIGVACTMLPAITIAGTAFSTLGLISAGFLGFAGLHAGSAAIDIMSAKTDAEAEQAWQNMGSALTEGGLAYLGYKASGGIMAKDTVAPTPSGSAPKTPKTPKTTTEEAPVEPTRTSAPKTETPVEEPVVTTSKAEPVAEKPEINLKEFSNVDKETFKTLLKERPWIKQLLGDEDCEAVTYQDLFVGHHGGSPNEVVNAYLRTGEIHPNWTKADIEEIITSAHYAMSKTRLPKKTILHRRVNDISYIPERGGNFTEKGFLSTSINDDLIYGYGDIHINILVPEGTPCIANGGYSELLLENGLTFKVLEKGDNYATLLCEKTNLDSNFDGPQIIDYSKKVILQPEIWVQKRVAK